MRAHFLTSRSPRSRFNWWLHAISKFHSACRISKRGRYAPTQKEFERRFVWSRNLRLRSWWRHHWGLLVALPIPISELASTMFNSRCYFFEGHWVKNEVLEILSLRLTICREVLIEFWIVTCFFQRLEPWRQLAYFSIVEFRSQWQCRKKSVGRECQTPSTPFDILRPWIVFFHATRIRIQIIVRLSQRYLNDANTRFFRVLVRIDY